MNKYLAQYRQQMSRLRHIQREAEKRGYIFPNSPLPRAVKNPTAKTIQRLSAITPTKLRSKGYKPSPVSGELIRQTPRRQEAERHEQELAKIRERNQRALQRYEERRRERLEERAKQAEEARKNERRILEEQVDNAQALDEILNIFNVQDPAELPFWAYKKYIDLQERIFNQEEEASDVEIHVKINNVNYQEDYGIEEPPEDYPRGKDIDEPAPYEDQILNNVIIEMHSRKNTEIADFLLNAMQDEISYLDQTYGDGMGETIMANRFRDVNGNWQNKLEQLDSSDVGEVRDGSFGLLGIIRGGHPASAENEELERIIYDQFKWKSINNRKRDYFRR